LVDIRLQDDGYERHLLANGSRVGTAMYALKHFVGKVAYGILRVLGADKSTLKRALIHPTDQTSIPGRLAQIQCILRKRG
jgi:hypothetical protein